MPTFGVIPHRTRSTVTVSLCDAPLTVQWQVLDAYGFGPASWEQLTAPGFDVGDAVTIACEGGTVHEGTVQSITDPDAVAESLRYRITTAPLADALKADETVEGVFVDRDLAQWKTATSGSSAAADFGITVEATDAVRFTFADVEPGLVQVAMAEPTLAEKLSETGNAVPPARPSQYNEPKPLWSAAYYHIGSGATSKRITSLAFGASWALSQPLIDAMTTPDYESPEGTPDPKYGNRHATYPDIALWSSFYGGAAPDNCFVGVYACDDLADLPTNDPEAMLHDSHRLFIMKHETAQTASASISGEVTRPRYTVDCTFIVFYAAYLPVRKPVALGERYEEEDDHLVRLAWVAMSRYFAEAGQWARFYDVEVCAQGYVPLKDGSDDLGRVFDILYADNSHPAMKLPPATDTQAPRSIALRSAGTMLAAIAELLSLHEDQFSWGIFDSGRLIIERPGSATAFACVDEPGVDTTGCGVSSEGAVDAVQVVYTLPDSATDPGMLTASRLGMLVVDAGGAYELVTSAWEPTPGQRVAFVDATGTANCAEAAAKLGQSIAIERRPSQATGTISLHAIADASRTRTGGLASGPGVPADARITGVAVNVDGDTVTLSLGSRGYEGRFAPRTAGKPATSSPTQATRPPTALETRRLVR